MSNQPATQREESNERATFLHSFLNIEYGVIGRTASTKNEPNTSSQFQFWLSKLEVQNVSEAQEVPQVQQVHANTLSGNSYLLAPIEIGNIVAAYSDTRDDITFGLVTEMRSYSDIDSFIADYLSHDFGDARIEVPTDISEVIVVTCNVMRNISLKTKPVGRSRVYFPSVLGIQFAYGIINERGEIEFKGAPIALGVFQNGDGTVAPISVDEDFLLGPEGAHMNVSGISGLASKTSSIEFALKSLLTFSEKRVAVVMVNVKSKDLLYIDQPNPRLQQDPWSVWAYQILGIPAEPFIDTRFFAPTDPTNRPNGTQSLRVLPTERFEWDLQMIYHQIPSLFDSMDWDDRMEGVWFAIQDEIERGRAALTYSMMLDWVNKEITRANNNQKQWIRGNHIATWNKMRSHLQRFPRSFQGLIAVAGQGVDIPFHELSDRSIFVIDIAMLNDRGQRLVFGRAMSAITRMLENEELDLDAVVVFVDELNKFAPSGNVRTPLKSRLVDITARGRSLGLILFGAEQFASSVDKEIVENSSTYLYGRSETNELRSPNFSAFSDEVKTKLTMLPQGQLLIKFAKFPQPIFLRFPFPPCVSGEQYNEM